MKPALLVGAAALMASVLVAAELDDKLIRLIGPDAKFVYGVDLDRHGNSSLNAFFPLDAVQNVRELENGGSKVLDVIIADGAAPDGSMRLAFFGGCYLRLAQLRQVYRPILR